MHKHILKLFLTSIIIFSTGALAYGAISDEAKLLYNKGIDFYKLGRFEQAMEYFKMATDLDPNYIDAYYNLGSLLEYMNQNEEALSTFKQIIIRKPEDYEAVYKAAELSYKLGYSDKAKMYLTIIPQDSLIGQRASQLKNLIDTGNPTIDKNSENVQQTNNSINTQNNGVYSDIPSPTGIATDNNGNLYVAGFSDNVIYKISTDNKKIVYIKNAKIDGPIGLVIDNSGNLYVANYNKNNVLKIDSSGQITEFINNIEHPYCMHLKNGMLYVSSQGSDSVIKYKISN